MFYEVYYTLRVKGVEFPETPVQTMLRQSLRGVVEEADDKVFGEMPEKDRELLADLNLVKGNINLANIIIDCTSTLDLQHSDHPLLDLLASLYRTHT